jgi:hypothetical protein
VFRSLIFLNTFHTTHIALGERKYISLTQISFSSIASPPQWGRLFKQDFPDPSALERLVSQGDLESGFFFF